MEVQVGFLWRLWGGSLLTLQQLLEVVHEEVGERGPLGPLQRVDQLLDLSRHPAADRHTWGDTGVPSVSRCRLHSPQLVNTLKRPKRPPLTDFFVDDFEELLEGPALHQVLTGSLPTAQLPGPEPPRPEGGPMGVEEGEPLGVVTNWPSSLEAGLQRWGTVSPKAPCLTCMDPNGKLLHMLTYGKLWSRSVKVAFNLLHKLGSKQEPLVHPGDRVALVFPNNDPASFMTSFYGCLLAQVVPVPIEVPLSRKDAGCKQWLLRGAVGSPWLDQRRCLGAPQDLHRGGAPQSKYKDVVKMRSVGGHEPGACHVATAGSDAACSLPEAETMVNVLDFKKTWESGTLTHQGDEHDACGQLVPYALMKVNPCRIQRRAADGDMQLPEDVCVDDGSKPYQGAEVRVICPAAAPRGADGAPSGGPGGGGRSPLAAEVTVHAVGLSHGGSEWTARESTTLSSRLQDVGGVMHGFGCDVARSPRGLSSSVDGRDRGAVVSSVATGRDTTATHRDDQEHVSRLIEPGDLTPTVGSRATVTLTPTCRLTTARCSGERGGRAVGERGFVRTGLLGLTGRGAVPSWRGRWRV
ncbi:unnamed protein product [Boreogadus saida]